MSHEPSGGLDPDGERIDGWPVRLAGITETVVATRGPDGRWNHAALGLDAGDPSSDDVAPVTASTFGRTRTRRNLEVRGEGFVQFTRDPVDFVAAALDVHETERPILDRTDAWVEIRAEAVDAWADAGTEVVEWRLEPVDGAVRNRSVPTTDRGYAAVIEASVAASRLGVAEYDDRRLRRRIDRLADVVARCGGPRERTAFERIREQADGFES